MSLTEPDASPAALVAAHRLAGLPRGVPCVLLGPRGLDGWYGYDFLDPTLDGGWARVFVATGQVLVAFLVVPVLVHAGGQRTGRFGGREGRPGRVAGPKNA
ncbi:hypothetical protein [Arthrobacter sp. ISL-85]|uniref:hypothetical protein n=1 Tax=Arthrobacter sp. ISL-85 TaxID=2819115 RepID=UPI0020352C09|nr:hypothetical protein [Arthrobacter sp. ISL-85]